LALPIPIAARIYASVTVVVVVITVPVMVIAVVGVMFAIPAAVLVPVSIPMVIVLKTAVIPIPVPYKVLSAVMMRRNPTGAHVRRLCPITIVPFIVPSHRIPIALDPNEIRARCWRKNANHARSRRRSDIDPN
jgi:hypothetical protein